ncbi:MAG: adenylate/guanylate cyclase domain-containing protein [Bdellovibrio sp.]
MLGFCNAPLPRIDFISRTLRAALEIRHRVLSEQGTYSPLWGSPLQVRVGIATGDVNVGFFGSQKYFRTYTAIGPAVNLASRLCSSADPNQILLSEEAANQVQDEFELKHIGSLKLKGFESLGVKAFELIDSKISVLKGATLGPSDCPNCGDLLQVETNHQGQFVFVCRSCFSLIDMTTPGTNVTREA